MESSPLTFMQDIDPLDIKVQAIEYSSRKAFWEHTLKAEDIHPYTMIEVSVFDIIFVLGIQHTSYLPKNTLTNPLTLGRPNSPPPQSSTPFMLPFTSTHLVYHAHQEVPLSRHLPRHCILPHQTTLLDHGLLQLPGLYRILQVSPIRRTTK